MSRFDTIGLGPARAGGDGRAGAARRSERRWPRLAGLGVAMALSLGLWAALVAAVRAVL